MGLFPTQVDVNLHPALFFVNPFWLISRFYDDEKIDESFIKLLKDLPF